MYLTFCWCGSSMRVYERNQSTEAGNHAQRTPDPYWENWNKGTVQTARQGRYASYGTEAVEEGEGSEERLASPSLRRSGPASPSLGGPASPSLGGPASPAESRRASLGGWVWNT